MGILPGFAAEEAGRAQAGGGAALEAGWEVGFAGQGCEGVCEEEGWARERQEVGEEGVEDEEGEEVEEEEGQEEGEERVGAVGPPVGGGGWEVEGGVFGVGAEGAGR